MCPCCVHTLGSELLSEELWTPEWGDCSPYKMGLEPSFCLSTLVGLVALFVLSCFELVGYFLVLTHTHTLADITVLLNIYFIQFMQITLLTF